jgi:hypothetical protein
LGATAAAIDAVAGCLYKHRLFLQDPMHKKYKRDPLGPSLTWACWIGGSWAAIMLAIENRRVLRAGAWEDGLDRSRDVTEGLGFRPLVCCLSATARCLVWRPTLHISVQQETIRHVQVGLDHPGRNFIERGPEQGLRQVSSHIDSR